MTDDQLLAAIRHSLDFLVAYWSWEVTGYTTWGPNPTYGEVIADRWVRAERIVRRFKEEIYE